MYVYEIEQLNCYRHLFLSIEQILFCTIYFNSFNFVKPKIISLLLSMSIKKIEKQNTNDTKCPFNMKNINKISLNIPL